MVFVDTWAWIALALRHDQHHPAAKTQHAEFVKSGRLYVTTDYVIGELITHLYRTVDANKAEAYVKAIFSGIESGGYRMERVSSERFASAWQLRQRYADKPAISFVDFTSFVTMRELGIQDVFTGDGHFAEANFGFRLFPPTS